MKQTAVLLIGCYTVRNKKVLVLPRFAATGAFSLATWVVVRVLMRYALKRHENARSNYHVVRAFKAVIVTKSNNYIFNNGAKVIIFFWP